MPKQDDYAVGKSPLMFMNVPAMKALEIQALGAETKASIWGLTKASDPPVAWSDTNVPWHFGEVLPQARQPFRSSRRNQRLLDPELLNPKP